MLRVGVCVRACGCVVRSVEVELCALLECVGVGLEGCDLLLLV